MKKLANYLKVSTNVYKGTKEKVFEDFPDAVIIDGDDDAFAPTMSHPDYIAKQAKIKPLAFFHSGRSGVTYSGIVIEEKDFNKFLNTFNRLSKDENLTKRTTLNTFFPQTKPIKKTLKFYRKNKTSEISYLSRYIPSK